MMNVTDNIDIEVGHRHGIEQIEDDIGPPNNSEQIEDHVGPSTKTGLNVSGSLDSDLKRKIAAASSNRNRDRVSSRVSSVSERDTAVSETGTGIGREDSKDITEVEESSSTAAVRSPTLHSTDDTTSAVQPSESAVQFYPIEATVVNQSQTTTTVDDNNDEEQVYEAEFVPRWKKYVLSGTIVFFAILTVSIVGGVLAGSRSSSDTKETQPPGQENMRISSDFCPTMYSDFFRRQLTYHSKEVFSIENDGGYLG